MSKGVLRRIGVEIQDGPDRSALEGSLTAKALLEPNHVTRHQR